MGVLRRINVSIESDTCATKLTRIDSHKSYSSTLDTRSFPARWDMIFENLSSHKPSVMDLSLTCQVPPRRCPFGPINVRPLKAANLAMFDDSRRD